MNYDAITKLRAALLAVADALADIQRPEQLTMQGVVGEPGISFDEAAKICGRSHVTIRNWESGIHTPKGYPGRGDKQALIDWQNAKEEQERRTAENGRARVEKCRRRAQEQQKRLLTIKAAASILGLGWYTTEGLMLEGKLPSVEITPGTFRITRDGLEAFLRGETAGGVRKDGGEGESKRGREGE